MREFALYKGEELITMGTLDEIAKERGVKPQTIAFYGRPVYRRRTSEARSLRLVKLEDDDG